MRRWIKSILPRGLLGRSLLILVTPMVLVELISAYVFFGFHWDLVTRRLALSLAGDIGTVIEMLRDDPSPAGQARAMSIADDEMDLHVTLRPGATLARTGMLGAASQLMDVISGYSLEENLTNALNAEVARPVFIDAETYPRDVEIQVQLADGVLDVMASRKRLYSPTTTVVVLWMVGTSLILVGIAVLFMKNQVRAVRRLAEAADALGKGRDSPDFHTGGATEVRRAGAAFLLMRQRLRRQIDQRTEMLAGVSHDLRTPITRMRLQLAMMSGEGVAELREDLADMEKMVEGYLAFARGEGSEPAAPTDLVAMVEDVVGRFRRDGAAIDLHCEEQITLTLRPQAVGRALTNLIGNATRYGRHVAVRAGRRADAAELVIDDDGPGIEAARREDVFKPFVRLDPSRNLRTGGVGLGLTIARDILRSHGGSIALEDSPLGGLRVRVRLPV